VAVPGGFLWDDEVTVAFHTPPIEELGNPRPYLGHLLIVTRRHVARLGDLTEDEHSGRAGCGAARAVANSSRRR
jgi:hypothetical protein